ncbi:MAG: hypothetical protein F8N37_09905 [Telmatospirillum sp.]|nr:hypothetical protein [Telmatospirillum sp.]
MQINSISTMNAALTALTPATAAPQSAATAPTSAGHSAPQDIVSLSNAARQAMQGADDGDGPGR